MKRSVLISAILVCLLLVAPASGATAKDNWISVRSKNFFLIGNASEKDIRQVAVKLEQFREAFGRLLPTIKFTSPIPTTVVVFKTDSAYKPYKPLVDGNVSSVAGYFQPGEDVNYITLSTERRSEETFNTIFHEYIHMLVNNTQGSTSTPPWFNEGLAEYYSTVEIKDDQKITLGRLLHSHLQLLSERDLWPLKTLFTVDSHSLHRNKRDAIQHFYAQSWLVFHYLILGNDSKRQPQLDQFLRLLFTNVPIDDAFRQAFQTDYATLEKELKEYARRSTFPARNITFNEKLKTDMGTETAPITEAQAQAYLGDLLLHTNRIDEAIAQLKRALALDANLGMGHASLGMALMRKEQFAEAKQHLQKATSLDQQNYLTHYYYAYVLNREAMSDTSRVSTFPAEAAQAMRAALSKAIELKPDFPESYRLLTFVNIVTNEQLDESIALIKKALTLSPGNQHYSLMLAEIYMRKQDFKTARQIVEPIAQKASDEVREHAQAVLSSLKSIEEQLARYAAQREAAEREAATRPTLKEREAREAAQPDTMSLEDRIIASLHKTLKKPAEGEERLQGVLTHVECVSKSIIYTIKVGDRLLRLRSDNFDSVDMIAYTDEVKTQINCGPRKPESTLVVIYRPAKDERRKLDGVAVSFEFVPRKFQLK